MYTQHEQNAEIFLVFKTIRIKPKTGVKCTIRLLYTHKNI